MEGDKWQVPDVAFVDTSAMLHGLGVGTNHPEAADCVQFLDEMEKQGNRVLVAALTIAEMRRRRSRKAFEALPRVSSIVPVAFNAEVAHLCGDEFPWPQGEATAPKDRTKFDIAIVATAIWAQRTSFDDLVFVSLDAGQRKRAEGAGLSTKSPADFKPRQLQLISSKRQPKPKP